MIYWGGGGWHFRGYWKVVVGNANFSLWINNYFAVISTKEAHQEQF